jgi:6-phosphogluconolactonase/glucosamine-6-phosphate isomerase/deaminase
METRTNGAEVDTGDTLLSGDSTAIAREAAAIVDAVARAAVAARGRCAIALSPAFLTPAVLDALAGAAARARAAWSATHLFLADTVFDAARYDAASLAPRLAARLLLASHQLHFRPAAARDAVRAAAEYELELAAFFALREGELPRFDLALLALAGDGRVAGLAAGGTALGELTRVAVADFVPAQRARVVTLAGPVLAAARQIVVRAADPGAHRLADGLRACRAQPDRCRPHVLAHAAGAVRFLIELTAAAAPAADFH